MIYDPEDPSNAYVTDEISNWLFPGALAGMGLIVTLVSFAKVETR